MARPAKNDFTDDEARRFRDGIRHACDWLDIAISDLRHPTPLGGHGERPRAWPYNALKHGFRSLSRDTAVSLWLRLNVRASEALRDARDRQERRRLKQWDKKRLQFVPPAIIKKLEGPLTPVPGFIQMLDGAFQDRNAAKVALRLSMLMAPRSPRRRARIATQLKGWFDAHYEPAGQAYLEYRRQPKRPRRRTNAPG